MKTLLDSGAHSRLHATRDEEDRFMKWTISNGIIFPQWGTPFINHGRALGKESICYSCCILCLHPPECDLGMVGRNLCLHVFFPNNMGFFLQSYNYRKTQNKILEQALQYKFLTDFYLLGTHTEPQFSSWGMKPTISYILTILQGILCLIT